jgi:hypothetical protein
MMASIFIVVKGNVNPAFSSLPVRTPLPGKFSRKQKISLSTHFPSSSMQGKISRQANPLSFTKFPASISIMQTAEQNTHSIFINSHLS